MKNFAFILAILVLFLATVPCCAFDNCPGEEATEHSETPKTGSEPEKEGFCSPFFSCHTCSGFAITPFTPSVFQTNLFLPTGKTYSLYRQQFVSQFSASIWQPPKLI